MKVLPMLAKGVCVGIFVCAGFVAFSPQFWGRNLKQVPANTLTYETTGIGYSNTWIGYEAGGTATNLSGTICIGRYTQADHDKQVVIRLANGKIWKHDLPDYPEPAFAPGENVLAKTPKDDSGENK